MCRGFEGVGDGRAIPLALARGGAAGIRPPHRRKMVLSPVAKAESC